MATKTRTQIDVTKELVSTTALAFIRQINLKITASQLKPNTKMYAFFDGVDVSRYFTPDGGSLGDQLITDSAGNLVATFDVPSLTFSTGDKELVIIDYDNFSVQDVIGTSTVRAKATFSSKGTLETYQTTETTTIITEVERIVPNYDPLAQSFFTYGLRGGCYLTSIDLFFLTKDDTLPVWVEIREMVNGYPGPALIGDYASSTLQPADVLLSTNGSVATNFKFQRMIYLEQDKDYCFVVRSNSSKYNVFTSKLGEKSLETGKVVFDQPYMGSLFKSENNITWTAEQTEDIKFILYRADFDKSVEANVEIALSPTPISISSVAFQTITGTDKIMASFPFQHGLRLDSKIAVSVDATGVYNGIPGTLLNGTFTVTNIISEYTLAFYVPTASATSSGVIETGGLIKEIIVVDGGSGYSNPTVTIAGAGSNAAATAIVKNGVIQSIVITNPGTGYFGAVNVSISDIVGSSAIATAYTTPEFTITTNRVYHTVKPQINYTLPQGTDITSSLLTTTSYFEGGNLAHYGSGKTYDMSINAINYLDSNLLLASRFNETAMMGGNRSSVMNIKLSSSNSNVSPIIDLSKSVITMRTNSINNQKNEVINSTNSSGSVLLGTGGVTITNGGSGYTSAPSVVITGTGTGATATCNISGGVVDSVTVTNGGSGYYGTAKVIFEGGGTPTTDAYGIANLTEYNSELKSGYGNALSRYVTKKQQVQNVSKGVRVYVTAFSNADSNFDVYIKTSLSSANVDHDTKEWKLLSCDVARNRSQNSGQYLEYEFYVDSIDPFDVYSLKFVLRTYTPWQPPSISNYRAIIVA